MHLRIQLPEGVGMWDSDPKVIPTKPTWKDGSCTNSFQSSRIEIYGISSAQARNDGLQPTEHSNARASAPIIAELTAVMTVVVAFAPEMSKRFL